MKIIFLLSLLSILATNVNASDKHSRHHNNSEEKKRHTINSLSLNNGKKWDVDQTMRESMDAINTQLKRTTENNYLELSDLILVSVNNITMNCKMEQKKDETFHTVLGEMMDVAEDLKDTKKNKHAIKKLNHALKVYTKYFGHSFSK